MKYPYVIDYTVPDWPIMRLPDEVGLVTVLLCADVQGPTEEKDFFLEEIERVLQGEIPTSEVAGNVCALEIRPNFTTVIDTLAQDQEDPKSWCVIETEELKNLLLAWLDLKEKSTVNAALALIK